MKVGDGATRVVIIGAGGFGKEVLQYASDAGHFTVAGFLDDRDPDELDRSHGLPILGTVSDYRPIPGESFLLAVGEPTVRSKIAVRFLEQGARFETVIHPLAYVASSANIGNGCIVAPFATIGAHSNVSDFSQVHFYASVAHDVVVERFCALSPYSAVNGGGHLGEGVFLGTRATINPLKSVGPYSKVAAGAVVYQDVPGGSLAAGNPAKARRLMVTPGGADAPSEGAAPTNTPTGA